MGQAATKKQSPIQDDQVLCPRTDTADTSLLYEELRRRFTESGEQQEVDFRQLVGWLRLGDQLTHHIHPYPAKLLPHIAHFFVRASVLQNANKIVLDPFCGSGTVALEASIAGLKPYVADANPFALLVTKAKTTKYVLEDLVLALESTISRARRYRTAPTISVVNAHLWYEPKHKKSLEVLSRAIEDISDDDTRDFFKISFSATTRRLSYADPAVSVPVRMREKDSLSESANAKIKERLKWIAETEALEEFERICRANIERVNITNKANPHRQTAIQVGFDARRLLKPGTKTTALEDDCIPLTVTSPPYGSAQKYIRASSLALNWLKLSSPNGLAQLESKSIGREYIPNFLHCSQDAENPLSEAWESLLQRIKLKNSLRERITRRYLIEIDSAIREIVRVTAPNGHAVIIIGNNQVCGEVMRTDLFLTERFQSYGMKLELNLIDHIKSRGLMTKRNKTASVISREVVLVFKKVK